MELVKNFSEIFLSVWNKGILGVDIFQIIIGLGIFLIFLIFRGLISKLIIQNLNKNSGKIIYVSGELISTKLDQSLIQEGYILKRVMNYKTNHNQKFDEKFVEELKLKIPDIVYIYSQNSAQSFLNFIKNYQFEGLWMNTNLVCIGEKASSILNEIKWKKIFLFNPGEEEFLLYKI